MNALHRPKILLIEDDLSIRELLGEVLEGEGYRVALAENGQEALRLLEESVEDPPSLILLDLMMPVMDGFEFRRAQLADRRFASIPVVVLSADRRIARAEVEVSACSYLKKPAGIGEILDAVRATAR